MREKLQKLGLVMILFIGMGGMANGQTDSIYALNSSVINDTIHASFNSTYDISKLQKVFLKMTNLSNPSDPLSPWTFFATPSINSTLFAKVGDFSYSNVSAGITKFSIVIYLPDNFHGQNTKLDFYLENNIVAKTEGTEFSNTLTYEYNAAITGITENNFEVELDRSLDTQYKINLNFNHVYVDLDDTLIINEQITFAARLCISPQINVPGRRRYY